VLQYQHRNIKRKIVPHPSAFQAWMGLFFHTISLKYSTIFALFLNIMPESWRLQSIMATSKNEQNHLSCGILGKNQRSVF
jgi:hypothetical protein